MTLENAQLADTEFTWEALEALRRKYFYALDDYTDRVNALSKALNVRCPLLKRDIAPTSTVDIYSDVFAGYLSREWDPTIWISLRGERVFETEPDSRPTCGTTLGTIRALRDAIDAAVPDYIKVKIGLEERPTVLRDEMDVKLVLGDEWECVTSGNVWYKGWDVPDRFIVAAGPDYDRMFITKDAHGGPMEEVFDLEEFTKLVEADSDNKGVIQALQLRIPEHAGKPQSE